MQVPVRVDDEVRFLAASQAGDLSSHACQLDDGFAAIVVSLPGKERVAPQVHIDHGPAAAISFR